MYNNERIFSENLVLKASKVLDAEAFEDMKIFDKGNFDIVTDRDVAVEEFIIKAIREKYPEDLIISEESKNEALTTKRTWVIDPIDGTVNYSRNIPLYGIQIAMFEDCIPVIGVIYLPYLNQLFSASKHQGAFLNGKKITVSNNKKLEKSIVTIGDFSKSSSMEERKKVNSFRLEKLAPIIDKALKLKLWGAASIDFTFLSAGSTDVHIMFSINIWDIAAGYVISKEAGAVLKTLEDNEFDFTKSTNILVASSENLIKEVLQVLKF